MVVLLRSRPLLWFFEMACVKDFSAGEIDKCLKVLIVWISLGFGTVVALELSD